MSPIHLRTALPLLLLVGVAAPVQADVGVSVECSDCDLLPEDVVILAVNGSLAQAMADDPECESAAHAAARSLSVDVTVTDVPECLADVPLYYVQFEGWQIVTTESSLATNRESSSSTGGSDDPCSTIVLGNILKQFEEPLSALSNSITIDADCAVLAVVKAILR